MTTITKQIIQTLNTYIDTVVPNPLTTADYALSLMDSDAWIGDVNWNEKLAKF